MKKNRYLVSDIINLSFNSNKMAFVSGPRQVGKTTMAKALLKQREVGQYYNWDEIKFRRSWTKDPVSIIPKSDDHTKALVVLDEIHKAKLWKRSLKGVYDTLEKPCDILVTGSAKLDIYRKGSDSLLGRYYTFRLHPFSLAELDSKQRLIKPCDLLNSLFNDSIQTNKETMEIFQQLETWGPFPEPLFAQSMQQLYLWQRNRIERLIREDLRDISRLPELSQVEMLASLLPERAANPLSLNSLSGDLEVAFNTIKRWLEYLKALYYHYEIKPYYKSLTRALKKEKKLYLWDWSEIENEGQRFENIIASHLLKYCHYLHDTGVGNFELTYIRNKEKKEIDFLILKNKKPWFPIEVKLNDISPSNNWDVFMNSLPCNKAIQVIRQPNVFKILKRDKYEILIISVDKFLSYLI